MIQSYQFLDLADLDPMSAMQIISIPESWGVDVVGNEIRIPSERYTAVIYHLNRAD